jgi:hypothetical protein
MRSEEVVKSGKSEWMSDLFPYPLFLTSALPIFTVLMPKDQREATRGIRFR